MQNFDNFLSAQHEGGLIDSTGSFTIDAEKALEKLAHSQLPDTACWVLKVAQFCTAFGVERVSSTLDAKVCRLHMDLPRPLDVSALIQGLGTVGTLKDAALDHLVTGLRALGGTEGRRFGLELNTNDSVLYLLWDGGQLVTKAVEQRSDSHFLSLEVTTSNPSTWSRIVDIVAGGGRVNEPKLLAQQACTVPFDFQVNDGDLRFSQDKPLGFVQPVLCDFLEQGDGIRLPHTFDRWAAYRTRSGPTRTSGYWLINYHYSLVHRALRWSPDPAPLRCRSRVHYLKDGIIVESEAFEGSVEPFSLDLFLDTAECPTDLGGLSLRRSEPFLRRRRTATDLLRCIDEKVKDMRGSIERLPGQTLEGWDAFLYSAAQLPMNGTLTYRGPGLVSTKLTWLPGFRSKLLQKIQKTPFDLSKLSLGQLQA
jgi:hypothetical protein